MRWASRGAWPTGSSSWTPAKSSRRARQKRFSRRRRASEPVSFCRSSWATRPAGSASRAISAVAMPSLTYNQLPHRFARTVAMERICSLLLDGAVPFDVPLSERAIADAIDIGRMPVREALRDLAREGIVSVEPGRGTFLRRLAASEVTELLEVRLAIEGMAARLAAEKGFVGELPQIVAELRGLTKLPFAGKRIRQAEAIGDRVPRAIVRGATNKLFKSLFTRFQL